MARLGKKPGFVEARVTGTSATGHTTRMNNHMIFLTRFDGTEVVVNCDLIVTVEKIPDTVLTLTTGDRIMVREPVEEVVERAASYRHRVLQGPGVRADAQDIAHALSGRAPVSPSSSPPPLERHDQSQGQQKDS